MFEGIVSTIPDRCKRCYSCIRECPAKAIKVVNGQAQVIYERCIVCGHCTKVCSRRAKKILSDVELVVNEIIPSGKAVAIVASSFPASFPDDYKKLPDALRKIGFNQVVENAFGADLIAGKYLEEIQSDTRRNIISSVCPAVVSYIEKYYPELVENLARVDSPMIALAKFLRANLGEDIKIVFIGPCISRKNEIRREEVKGLIDAVLTFSEIKKIFKNKSVDISSLQENNFDPPAAYKGKAYPLPGGILKLVNVTDDILEKDIIVAEGKKNVLEIVEEISQGKITAKFVDILFCEGCISGPAVSSNLNYYSRREKVINYINESINSIDKKIWKSTIYNNRHLNFRREFKAKNQRRPVPSEERIKEILSEINIYTKEDELNCGSCGYHTCREFAIAIAKDLAEKEMCLPFVIDELRNAYEDLKDTQEQLKTAEKLASIGQLAAGIAHEINNPLGTIMLYSSMLKNKANNNGLAEDLQLIEDEAKRCKNIVANLLNFARQGKLTISSFDINQVLDEVIKSVSIKPNYSGVKFETETYPEPVIIEGDRDQIKQVLLNIISNACEAVEGKDDKKVNISLQLCGSKLNVKISDNGCGIKKEDYGKIFTPFFTTKKLGEGTGLGLAITYGIIKMHRGTINFQSEEGKGTTFTIQIPLKVLNENILLN